MALSSSESEYEIEEILKHRKRGGRNEYYVTWKGFDESEDQWVKESNIHALALLQNYKEKNMGVSSKAKTSKKASTTTLVKRSSTKTANSKTVTSMKASSLEEGSNSYDYVESEGTSIPDENPVTRQQSSKVSRLVVQESGDLGSTMSESSDVELDTPMVTRYTSTVSRTIIQEGGDVGGSAAVATSLNESSSSSSASQHAQSSCETVSLLIFISCFLFVIASIVLEKHELWN